MPSIVHYALIVQEVMSVKPFTITTKKRPRDRKRITSHTSVTNSNPVLEKTDNTVSSVQSGKLLDAIQSKGLFQM
jgi:hypothetical protein